MLWLHVNQTKLQKAINGLTLDAQYQKLCQYFPAKTYFNSNLTLPKIISNNDQT